MSTKGTRPRAATRSATARHSSRDRSAPVGLWQQPCSRTRSPASARPSALIISSKQDAVVALVDNRDRAPARSRRCRSGADDWARSARRRRSAPSGSPATTSSAPSRSAPQPPGVCRPTMPVARIGGAEHDRPDQLGEALVALRAEIGLGFLRLEQISARPPSRISGSAYCRRCPEHADADVDLVGPGIGGMEPDEREQRIRRLRARAGRTGSAGLPSP